MTAVVLLVGAWCVAAVAVVLILVWRHIDRWAQRSFDSHVDAALAQADARRRHPSQRWVTGDHVCSMCDEVYPGPSWEHLHGRVSR